MSRRNAIYRTHMCETGKIPARGFRALLMGNDDTNPIYQAMTIGFLITIACLFGGIWLGITPIPVALSALTLGVGVELLYLWRSLLNIEVQPFAPAIAKT